MAAAGEKQPRICEHPDLGPTTPMRTGAATANDGVVHAKLSQPGFSAVAPTDSHDLIKTCLDHLHSEDVGDGEQDSKTLFRFIPSPNPTAALKMIQPVPHSADDCSDEDVVIAVSPQHRPAENESEMEWLFPGALMDYFPQLFESSCYSTDRDMICEYLEDLADDVNSWGRIPDPLDSSDTPTLPACGIKTPPLSSASLASVMNALLGKGGKVSCKVEKLIEVQSEHVWRCAAVCKHEMMEVNAAGSKHAANNPAAQYETLMRECEKLRTWRKLLQLFKCIRKDWLEHADQDAPAVSRFDVQRLWVLVEGMCNRAYVEHRVISNQQQLCPACNCTYEMDQANQAAQPAGAGSPGDSSSPYNKLRVAPPPAFNHNDTEYSPSRPPSFAVVTPRKDSDLALAARMVTSSVPQPSSNGAKSSRGAGGAAAGGLPKYPANASKGSSKPKSRLGRVVPNARQDGWTGAAPSPSAAATQSALSPDAQSGSPKSQSLQQESISAAQTLSSSDSGMGHDRDSSPRTTVQSPTGSSIHHGAGTLQHRTGASVLVDSSDLLSAQQTLFPACSKVGSSKWLNMLNNPTNPYSNGSPVLKRKFNSMAAPSFAGSSSSGLRDEPSLQLACELNPSSWVLDPSLGDGMCPPNYASASSLIPVGQAQGTLAPSKVRRLTPLQRSPNASPPLTPPSAFPERASLRLGMLPDLSPLPACHDQLLRSTHQNDLPNLSMPISSSPLAFNAQVKPEEQLLDSDVLQDMAQLRTLLQFGSGPQGTLERMPSDVLVTATYPPHSTGLNSPVLDCTELDNTPTQGLQSLLPLGSWMDQPQPLAFSSLKTTSLHSGSLMDSASQQHSQYSPPHSAPAGFQDLHAGLSNEGMVPHGIMMPLGGLAALLHDAQGGSIGPVMGREGSDGWGTANYLRLSREPSLNPVELMQVPDTSCFPFGAGHVAGLVDLPCMEDMIDSMAVRCSATRRRTTSCTQEQPSSLC